jgi:hypothetical protein
LSSVIASEAKQSRGAEHGASGLLRRFAPRNDNLERLVLLTAATLTRVISVVATAKT